MKLNNVMSTLNSIKPGTFSAICFQTECPVKAEFARQGIKIKKVTSMVARFKINYGAIKEVKLQNEERAKVADSSSRASATNNYSPVVKNAIYHNSNTNKDYLNVYTIKNSHKKTTYYIFEDNSWKLVTANDIAKSDYLIDSYFRQREKSKVYMFRVNVNNIISLNKQEV